MISHFLARDFKTFKMHWMLLALASAVLLPNSSNEGAAHVLTLIYLMFAIVPTQQIIGVKFRSQHVMSRNYLLSLPISRKTNFRYIVLRAQLFTMPLVLWLYFRPEVMTDKRSLTVVTWSSNWHLLLLLPVYGVWFFCFQVNSSINWERISSYLTSSQRLQAWILSFCGYFIETSTVIAIAAFSLISVGKLPPPLPPAPAVALTLALCVLRVHFTQKKWAET